MKKLFALLLALVTVTTFAAPMDYFADRGTLSNAIWSLTTSLTGPRHYRGKDLFYTTSAIASNAQVRVLVVGDSIIANGELYRGVRGLFNRYLGHGGFGSGYNYSSTNLSSGFDAGAQQYALYGTSVTSSYIDSYSPVNVYQLSTGGIISNAQNSQITGGVNADYLSVYYHSDPGFGSFVIATQSLNTAWGNLATINASVGGAGVYQVTNFSLVPAQQYNWRITSTGSNVIATVGIYQRNRPNTHVWAQVAYGGMNEDMIVTNAGFYRFYTNYAPQLVIFSGKSQRFTLTNMMGWTCRNLTNSDLVYATPTPSDPDTGELEAAEAMLTFGQTYNLTVFHAYGVFSPSDYWLNLLPYGGLNIFQDGLHLGGQGITYEGNLFLNFLNLSDATFALRNTNTPAITVTPLDVRANISGTIQTAVPQYTPQVFAMGSVWKMNWPILSGEVDRYFQMEIGPDRHKGFLSGTVRQCFWTTNRSFFSGYLRVYGNSLYTTNVVIASSPASYNVDFPAPANLANGSLYWTTNTFTLSDPTYRDGILHFIFGTGGTAPTNTVRWVGALIDFTP